MTVDISVIVPTHNPDHERLRRTLEGLSAQSCQTNRLEVIIVDNASWPAVELPSQSSVFYDSLRVILEPQLGLTYARKTGLRADRR